MKGLTTALTLICCFPAVIAAVPDPELSEVVVTAPEPRYVAPTTRDRIGRVWVPVQMDGKGPFRLVLDTGAQHSAVISQTAEQLGIPLEGAPRVLVHGTTGSAIAPTIAIDTLQLGELSLRPSFIPVVADVFGGADGLLGTAGMQEQRIFIDFRHDLIHISRSQNHSAAAGFTTLDFLPNEQQLMVVRAHVGGVAVHAIIDTGSQATIGNLALQKVLRKKHSAGSINGSDQVWGATGEVQSGVGVNLSPISLGALVVRNAHVTFADLQLFNHWELGDEPALLIGMDIIGLLDQMVIDYHRRELQIRPRTKR